MEKCICPKRTYKSACIGIVMLKIKKKRSVIFITDDFI